MGWRGLGRCLCLNPLGCCPPTGRVRIEHAALPKAGLWRSSTPTEAAGSDMTLRGTLIGGMACRTMTPVTGYQPATECEILVCKHYPG